MKAAKVEVFSDGAFAVEMTLLIYQVVTPHFEEEKSNSALMKESGRLWPHYLSKS